MFARLWGSSSTSSSKKQDVPTTRPQQLRTPSPSTEAPTESVPPRSPERALHGPESEPSINAVTPDALLKQLRHIPPQTLHEYFRDHLREATPSELLHLESFLHALAPPPRLHCARCHKTYTEVENGDTACHVAHDDEAADVQRAGNKDGVSAYETYWACCDRTVAGDGDLGPPDGWCYEGKHTTDRKRARFRYDSNSTDDKLQSCEERRCGQHHKRKRSRRQAAEESDAESAGGRSIVSARSVKTTRTAKTARSVKTTATKPRSPKKAKTVKVDPDAMEVDGAEDADTKPTKPRKKRKSVPA